MQRQQINIENETNIKETKSSEDKETESPSCSNGDQLVLEEDKLNIKGNNNKNIVENMVPVSDEQLADFYKLPVELIMEIFDFLTLEELNSVCQTSKWFQKVARACYKQNYSFFHTKYDKLSTDYRFGAFKRIIRRIHFFSDLHHFVDFEFEFRRLKEIMLFRCHLSETQIEKLSRNRVLRKLESLCISHCSLDPSIIELILSLSPNLKRLFVGQCDLMRSKSLHFKHPTLDRFGVNTKTTWPITTILELNPNIRYLEIDSANLWVNKNSLKTSKVSLNDLAVYIGSEEHSTEKTMFASMCHLLNELHELGIYKRLKLYVEGNITQEMVNEIAYLNAIVKLYMTFSKHCSPLALSTLRQIEEFHVHHGVFIKDAEAMAENLVNLKMVHIRTADSNSIIPFVKRATNMEKIKIDHLEHKVINLAALNRERLKLPNAKKITIYVGENSFLATKRQNRETDLDLIKLQRSESIEWDHDFAFRMHG